MNYVKSYCDIFLWIFKMYYVFFLFEILLIVVIVDV